jgi:8-oxo-dGTP pyrophosphatase MutT (NUDIX family)
MKTPVLSAGVVVVRRTDQAWRYLLLRVFNYWDFPKGMVEAGEDPWAAACREVEEETGLTALDPRWGLAFRETEPYSRPQKVARYYLAESSSGEVLLRASAELGRAEHHEHRWFAYADARPLLVPRLVVVLDWANEVIGDD